uniref:RRM domain-containing protein n=1 Tax=Stomoxys calcitrans TaxID=35570 RepID=A0A1I8PNS2_STOCA
MTHDLKTGEGSNCEALPVILENGRKVYGPPPNYKDPAPTYQCELYVTRIPQQLDELAFLRWLHRIGPVYEFRLMMDTGSSNRGYAFIRYCSENNALAAFELLKHLFVCGSEDRLGVYRSQGKNRLYISGIPRAIPLPLLQENFKLCFPQMHSCTAYPPLKQCNKKFIGRENEENRGFAFIEFKDHEMALEAKKRLTPGRVRMWGVDLKVQWAKPKEELQLTGVGTKNFSGYPNNRNNAQFFMPNDFCAKLRLYCLANNFNIPIVVYGPAFYSGQLQYAGILLKHSSSGMYSMYIFEIAFSYMSDIHLAICEVAVKMIERQIGHLFCHGLFRVVSDTQAELVHTFKTPDELSSFNLSRFFNRPYVMRELAISLQLLAEQSSEKILALYKRSFLTNAALATFELNAENAFGKFSSILPKFRNNRKLNNNFNDMEITLLQNPAIGLLPPTDFSPVAPILAGNLTAIKQEPPQLFTLRSQQGFGINYLLQHVEINSLMQRACYHPDQRVNSNPVWIAGQSYQKSIYN